MRRWIMIGLAAGVMSTTLFAQTAATGKEKIGWDQDAVTLATAQAYKVDVELDGTIAIDAGPVVCSGSSTPYLCTSPFPASLSLGAHTIRVRIIDTDQLTSDWSASWAILVKKAPGTPGGLHVVNR